MPLLDTSHLVGLIRKEKIQEIETIKESHFKIRIAMILQ